MRFCDKLPKLRKNNNYSQEQLAEKLNVSRQAVSKWELRKFLSRYGQNAANMQNIKL